MKQSLTGYALLVRISFAGRRSKNNQNVTTVACEAADTSSIRIISVYTKGFRMTYTPTRRLVDINDPRKKGGESFHCAFVPKDVEPESIPVNYTVVETPIKGAICMTSLQLSNLIELDALSCAVSIASTRHLFNEEINERLKQGKTTEIGIEGNFDNEVIMSVSPDVIFISPFRRGRYDAMHEAGIPLVPHLGYKEMTPLGQVEWIRFIGFFIGEEETASRGFAAIEKHYNGLKEWVAHIEKRPVVFGGEIRGGNWYAVGGKSFLTQLFHDAGADHFLKDGPRSGDITLDFEAVCSQAEDADYWHIVNSFDGVFSYDALKSEDPRYTDFRAFRNRGVIYCDMREKPLYESMPTQPEVVLEDLIKAPHPDLLPDYTPVYYGRLN